MFLSGDKLLDEMNNIREAKGEKGVVHGKADNI
jgi:hypothetical protein